MERRFGPILSVETRDSGKTLIGYAAVFYDGTQETEFDYFGMFRERIMPGAFDRAIQEKQDVRALFNHNPDHVLGRIASETLKLEADQKGLRYTISLGETTAAKDVALYVARRDVRGSSFAFQVVKQSWTDIGAGNPDVREITDLDLFDVGPVTFPAYESTTAEMKSRSHPSKRSDTIRQYRAWKQQQKAELAEIMDRAANL